MRWATFAFSFSGTWRIVVGILAPHSSQKVDIPFFLAMIPTRCDWGDHVGCWSEVEAACRAMAVLWRHAARIGREDLVVMAVARLGNNFVSEFIAGSNCCLVEKKFGWAKGGRFFDASTWHSPAAQFVRYFSLAEHRPRLIPSSYISTYVSVRNLDYIVALDRDGWIDGWMDETSSHIPYWIDHGYHISLWKKVHFTSPITLLRHFTLLRLTTTQFFNNHALLQPWFLPINYSHCSLQWSTLPDLFNTQPNFILHPYASQLDDCVLLFSLHWH